MKTSPAFEKAFANLMKHEGGWVNDPDDPGGATKYGVSLRFLKGIYPSSSTYKALFGTQRPSAALVNSLTPNQAKSFFNSYFWRPIKGDELQPSIANAVADFAYNAGVRQALKTAQRTLNATAMYSQGLAGGSVNRPLVVDGVMGPKTLARFQVQGNNPRAFLDEFADQRILFYQRLAERSPRLRKFLRGWINRATHETNLTLLEF